MNNLIYFLINIFGFLSLFISCYFINKKLKVLTFEKLTYSYILALIFFLLFSKIFYIVLELDVNSFINFISGKNIYLVLKFIFSKYSFIGGYIGVVVSIYLFSKLIKMDFKKILSIYLTSIILMYSIMKVGCYIKGCCIGKILFPIQLLESIINMIVYVYIISKFNSCNMNKIMGYSLIGFGLTRFIISMLRVYSSNHSFIFIEIICLILLIVGIIILKTERSKK